MTNTRRPGRPGRPAGPAGIWLGASYVLRRDVPIGEPYPHICGVEVIGHASRTQLRIWRRDCAACAAASAGEATP